MGAGGSPPYVEAAYTLRGPIAAGSWGLIGDGIVAGSAVSSINVRFEGRLRRQGAADDSGDQVLFSVDHTFVRDQGSPFNAVAYTTSVAGQAGQAAAGDRLVLRTTALGGDPGAVFILNGEGMSSQGRIPRIDLPAPPQ